MTDIFPVKCAGCGGIYDANSFKKCPACDTVDIEPRRTWTKNDFERADKIMHLMREAGQ